MNYGDIILLLGVYKDNVFFIDNGIHNKNAKAKKQKMITQPPYTVVKLLVFDVDSTWSVTPMLIQE
jgi:hypothetical protein